MKNSILTLIGVALLLLGGLKELVWSDGPGTPRKSDMPAATTSKPSAKIVHSVQDLLDPIPPEFKWDKVTLRWAEPQKSSANSWAKGYFAGWDYDVQDCVLTGGKISEDPQTKSKVISADIKAQVMQGPNDGRLFVDFIIWTKLDQPWVDRLFKGPILMRQVHGQVSSESIVYAMQDMMGFPGKAAVYCHDCVSIKDMKPTLVEADLAYAKTVLVKLLEQREKLRQKLKKVGKAQDVTKDVTDIYTATKAIVVLRDEILQMQKEIIEKASK